MLTKLIHGSMYSEDMHDCGVVVHAVESIEAFDHRPDASPFPIAVSVCILLWSHHARSGESVGNIVLLNCRCLIC
jgi:hypothetical protein